MENILANAALLNRALLETDEEQYDIDAQQVLAALKKLQINDVSKVLEVCFSRTLAFLWSNIHARSFRILMH